MINFKEGISTDYPYPYIKVENCFDEETLEKLIEEFPDVSSEGTVLSLSPFTGETISKIKIKGSFISEPIQVNEKIYLISKEGSLYILE